MRAVFIAIGVLFVINNSREMKECQECVHRYHYWRPFFGEFHPDDFIAATDVLGKNSYIGKFIPITERRSWTISTQLNYDFMEFSWEDGIIRRVHRFLEILAVEHQFRSRFVWIPVKNPSDLCFYIKSRCLVEGGVIKYGNSIVTPYIGRVCVNGSFFIGPVFEKNWAMRCGMHYLNGWKRFFRTGVFHLLSYTP